ncbi:MAG: hypothetical protein ACKPKO_07730, partial [Candidatus Fonsibacter sp.]
ARPSDLLVHDQAISSGLPVAEIYRIHKMSVPMLKGELVRRGYYVRTDTSKNEMINTLIQILAESRRGSPMDVDHTPGG